MKKCLIALIACMSMLMAFSVFAVNYLPLLDEGGQIIVYLQNNMSSPMSYDFENFMKGFNADYTPTVSPANYGLSGEIPPRTTIQFSTESAYHKSPSATLFNYTM